MAQEAAAQQEQVSENETPVVESEYADIAIAQVDNYVNVRTEPNTESEVVRISFTIIQRQRFYRPQRMAGMRSHLAMLPVM